MLHRNLLLAIFFTFSHYPVICQAQFPEKNKTKNSSTCLGHSYYEKVYNSFGVRAPLAVFNLEGVKANFSEEVKKRETAIPDPGKVKVKSKLSVPFKKMSAKDKKYVEGYLNYISKCVQNIVSSKFFRRPGEKPKYFEVKILGKGLNMTAPKENDWTLYIPEDVFKDILKRSLSYTFNKIEGNEAFADLFRIGDERDARIITPAYYFNELNTSVGVFPPCLPVIKKNVLSKLMNDKKLRDNKYVDSNHLFKDLETQLLEDQYEEQVKIGRDLLIDTNDIVLCGETLDAPELKQFIKLFDLSKLSKDTREVFELFLTVADSLEDSDEELDMKRIKTLSSLGNTISQEVFNYFVFIIAHEAYHAWFANSLIGEEHEYNADKLALYIYLKFHLVDSLAGFFFPLENSFLRGEYNDFLQIPAREFDTEEQYDRYVSDWEKRIQANYDVLKGREVLDLFRELAVSTGFYEKRSASHPALSKRVNALTRILKKVSIKEAEINTGQDLDKQTKIILKQLEPLLLKGLYKN